MTLQTSSRLNQERGIKALRLLVLGTALVDEETAAYALAADRSVIAIAAYVTAPS